ncbi:MAG TPA: Rv3235 family protein [Pseudonocardiaceae bacterium]
MTSSITETRPQVPVLRRLVDILPSPAPAIPEPRPTAALPAADPTAPLLVQQLLRAAGEIIGGHRPARQLSTVLRPDLLSYLMSLQAMAGHLEPRVGKVLTRQPAAGALEAVALVTLSTGVRALAARFEEHVADGGSQWRCTALQLRLTAGDLAARRR